MLLTLDFAGDIPIYRQIRNQVVIGIAEGRLKPGEKLPTIRALAEESGINMMTVSKAYQALKNEGYIVTDRRSGAVITDPKAGLTVPSETRDTLKLALSELRLSGLGKEEVLSLCETLYRELSSEKEAAK